MNKLCIDLMITVAVILTEIVIATGIIFKQYSLAKKGGDPTKAVQLPKLPKTEGQKLKEKLEREKKLEELMKFG